MCKTLQRFLGLAIAIIAFATSPGCTTVRRLGAVDSNAPSPDYATTERVLPPIMALNTAPPPSTTPVLPAPNTPVPNTTQPPAVTGTRLPTPDIETATEKAIELTRKLNEAETDGKRLAIRVQELEAAGKVKDQALDQARVDVQSARSEMAKARQELEQWRQEITSLRDKLRGADEENLHTLQTAVSLLQQILRQAEEHETAASQGASAQ